LSREWRAVKQVNYATVFENQKNLEDSLESCMSQYEERLRRVNDYMEQSNQSYLQAQEELKMCRLRQETDQKWRDQFLT